MVEGNIKVGRNIEWYLIWVVSQTTQFTQIKYHPIISTLTVFKKLGVQTGTWFTKHYSI
jgi:hypothetical protein